MYFRLEICVYKWHEIYSQIRAQLDSTTYKIKFTKQMHIILINGLSRQVGST